ncbi:DUF4307 domain-containing protein [Propionibacteriaceae bacterium Y1923]
MAEHPTATTPGEADLARVANRYPKKSSGRTLAAVGLVLLLALVGWTVWAGLTTANPGIHGQLYGYKVIDDSSIEVTVHVHRPDPSKAGSCTVQAQAPNGETVAELDLPVSPSSEKDVELNATLKTYLRAHTAIVADCSLD